ncbi:MAG: C40 family peptidase [Nocardioidaceae bacterium]
MRKLVYALVLAAALALSAAHEATAGNVAYRAYKVARAQLGDKYQYGAEGPDRFDCSGLTWYSYKLAGRPIRRTTQAQYLYSQHIPAAARHLGDLVFFLRSGLPRHVGIYAGRGYMIHANSGSYYGRKVIRERITGYWLTYYSVRYARITRAAPARFTSALDRGDVASLRAARSGALRSGQWGACS